MFTPCLIALGYGLGGGTLPIHEHVYSCSHLSALYLSGSLRRLLAYPVVELLEPIMKKVSRSTLS